MPANTHHQISIHPAPHKDHPKEKFLIVEKVELIQNNEITAVSPGDTIAFRLYNNSSGEATFTVHEKWEHGHDPNPTDKLFGKGQGTIKLTQAVPHVFRTVISEAAKHGKFLFQREQAPGSASEEGSGPRDGMTGTISVSGGTSGG